VSEITIATARGGVATKQICRANDEFDFTGYPNEKWWRFRDEHIPEDLPGLERFLADRAEDTASCCLYGQPIYTGMEYQRRLLHATMDTLSTLREVAREYLILDFDSAPISGNQNFLADSGAAIGSVVDSIADLYGVAFAYSLSCSAGFKAGIRAKAIVLLIEAIMPTQLRLWADEVNATLSRKVIDPSVLAAAQPIYFAKPVLHGVVDPCPVRVGVRPGIERASLRVPAQQSRPVATGAVAGGPSGWPAHLKQLGPKGFHDVLIAAAGSVVWDRCAAPTEPDATFIYDAVRVAVLHAEPGSRGRREIERYASRAFWDEAIHHALRRQQYRLAQIASSVAGIRRP
jgi:hypothetical protein